MNTPEYLSIVEDVKARIASGELKPGDKLPSYHEMAKQYDLSVSTVSRAVMVLRALGLVYGLQGKATYVSGSSETTASG